VNRLSFHNSEKETEEHKEQKKLFEWAKEEPFSSDISVKYKFDYKAFLNCSSASGNLYLSKQTLEQWDKITKSKDEHYMNKQKSLSNREIYSLI
jgi:hypothetical protein